MLLRLTTAVALVCSALGAAVLDAWVPARWQGGPLELARRPKAPAMLRDWYTPRTLEFLESTPINCLLVTWSAGADAEVESEQRKLVTAYARAAHERRIAVVGLLFPGADAVRATAAAGEAGLDGVALDGGFAERPQAPFPVIALHDGAIPRVRVLDESGGAMATPSSEPWIDSNIWLVRSLGAPQPWLGYSQENPSSSDYARAIADAAVAGGRWVVAPDDALLAGLWRSEPEALRLWRRVGDCIRFHEEHAEWRAFAPVATLGVVRDRSAGLSDENLNLITRRRIPYRIIERSSLSAAALEKLPAVLATDLDPPTPAERKILDAYAKSGGVLVDKHEPDPESLARDLADLIGADKLPVRLYHVSSVLAHTTASPDGTRLLVQLVNYATEPSEQVTVRAAGEFRTARLFSPGAAPTNLKLTQSGSRVDVRIDRIDVYAALLLEK